MQSNKKLKIEYNRLQTDFAWSHHIWAKSSRLLQKCANKTLKTYHGDIFLWHWKKVMNMKNQCHHSWTKPAIIANKHWVAKKYRLLWMKLQVDWFNIYISNFMHNCDHFIEHRLYLYHLIYYFTYSKKNIITKILNTSIFPPWEKMLSLHHDFIGILLLHSAVPKSGLKQTWHNTNRFDSTFC